VENADLVNAPTASTRNPRPPLTREGIIDAAVARADSGGIASISMRKLARELGVEAMSLYHHVADKEALLDGMVNRVFEEIEPPSGGDWKESMLRRGRSARRALLRHRWAIGLMDSRTEAGPATLRHHESVIGCLREAGFSLAATAHAFAILDSFIYGFVLQEVTLPFQNSEEVEEVAEAVLEALPPGEFPHLRELTADHVLRPGYDFGDSYEVGLELILDGLDRLRGG
jgi:AcrR family transcriptional regulator